MKNKSFSIEYTYSYGSDLATYFFTKPNPYPGPEPSQANGRYWQA